KHGRAERNGDEVKERKAEALEVGLSRKFEEEDEERREKRGSGGAEE
ncbi:uncharacterized, partial [Tachysurus ichikawai]